jgi:hypothetical protein
MHKERAKLAKRILASIGITHDKQR